MPVATARLVSGPGDTGHRWIFAAYGTAGGSHRKVQASSGDTPGVNPGCREGVSHAHNPQGETRRFISAERSSEPAVSGKCFFAPLFLDSPETTPYLVFVAQPDHKIGYPDPISATMKRSESMDLNVPETLTSPVSAGPNDAPARAAGKTLHDIRRRRGPRPSCGNTGPCRSRRTPERCWNAATSGRG
jgi:hypothetical protein